MQATPWKAGALGLGGLVVALLLGGLTLTATGCNDGGESEMYQQMMAGGNTTSTRPQPDSRPDTPVGVAEALPDEDVPVELVLVEDLVIERVDVRAPYPEFDGEGRYEVTVFVMTEVYAEPQVYRIVALDEEGNEVGSQEKHLKLPQKKARSINFNGFYCTHMPFTVEFYLTGKQAVAASDGGGGTAGVSGGSGASGGAETAPPSRGWGASGDDDS
jgi:hypothetical protein